MSFTIGDTIGPYRITDQIGQGGMATVYKAYHANLDRYVAFKVLHQAFLEDSNFLERFKREAQIVAKLEHPHIVQVYDFADHEGQPYLIMKFIEGETLKAQLKRESLPLDLTIQMLEAVANALTYAHEGGILHRDIKPSNIMLDTHNTPYIADFGLARIAQAGESTLSQDMMLGTPQYISPEQARGDQNLGPGTDIYSLGVVIYEMMVGRVPFSADTPFAIIHDHIYKPLPLPSKVNPEVPVEVERVLLKALAKEPAARYASAVDMIAAFRSAVQEAGMTELSAARYRPPVLTGSPAAAEPETPATQSPAYTGVPSPVTPTGTGSTASRRAYRRRANLWILGGFGVLLLTCLLSLFIVMRAISHEDLRPWSVEAKTDIGKNPGPPPGDAPVSVQINSFDIPSDITVEQAQQDVDDDPTNPANYFVLALAYMKDGNREEAISTAIIAINRLDASPTLIADVARYVATNEQDELAAWLYLETIAQRNLPPEIRNEAGEFLSD
ncbi:MAG: serine/threonine protein kinase, partial [Anaerolineae bacterium]|nr:serine/threonine protein kinase [Anaerolineae bacterium]